MQESRSPLLSSSSAQSPKHESMKSLFLEANHSQKNLPLVADSLQASHLNSIFSENN